MAKRRDTAAVAVIAEASALVIALAVTIVPGRTGSTWSPADHIWDDPTFLLRFGATFLFTNLLLVALGVGGWLFLRRRSDST